MCFLPCEQYRNSEIKLVLLETVPPDPVKGYVPAYRFSICNLLNEPLGEINFRLGTDEQMYYCGHIGYRIHEPFRGHGYAGKACLLVFDLARAHGYDHLLITCNPDNIPSRKTLEHLHGTLLEIASLPEDNEMRLQDGETEKCIFRFEL